MAERRHCRYIKGVRKADATDGSRMDDHLILLRISNAKNVEDTMIEINHLHLLSRPQKAKFAKAYVAHTWVVDY